MFRGGTTAAVPTTRPVGRLNLLSQQSGEVLQQAADCEFKQKWRAGLNHKILREPEEAPKPESQQNIPQWKRKQEQEKKPEEAERKVEPLWKRIREAEKKQESERNQELKKSLRDEKPHKPEITMERNRPEPLWKKRQEPGKLQTKLEPERKPDPLSKGKQEATKIQEIANKQEQEKKVEVPQRQELQKIEPVKKLEPLWKRKFEPVKKPEPNVIETSVKKTEPIWKRNIEPEKKQPEIKQEPVIKLEPKINEITVRKTEPIWKRNIEPEKKQPEIKQEPVIKAEPKINETTVKKMEPIWKRKIEPENKQPEIKQEPVIKAEPKINETPVKKLEPVWKRKIEPENKQPEIKQEPVIKPEPKINETTVRKTEPVWKRKIEPEKKQPEIKQEPVIKAEPKINETTVRKTEPIWKRKIEPEEKQELETKQEPGKKPVPLWKKKKEPEKEPEQTTAAPKKPDSLGKNKQGDGEKNKDAVSGSEKEQSTEDLPEEDETEELLCPMCSELFDENEYQPVLLPRCGHTFCRPCLTTVKKKGHFPCPTCRKRHLKPPVEDLPVHNEVLSRANAFREDKFSFSKTLNQGWNVRTGKCQTHLELLVYWCRNCQAPLCASCRVMNGHNIVRTRVVLQEKRQEMKERGQTILDNVLDEKKKIIDSVKTCSVQLLKVCEESVAVDGSSQDVKAMLTDTKQTADLSFVLRSLERMKSILGFYSKAASDTEADENTTPKVRRRKERQLTQQGGDACTNENNKTFEKKATSNPAENKKDFPTKQDKDIIGNTKVHQTMDVRLTHQQPRVGGMRGCVPAEVMSQGPLLSLADASLWPLTCCVYTENGRRARLARNGGRLHMSALTQKEAEAHFMIKLSVIQGVIPQDHPEVFLEVEAGEQRLGRIYIKLWGHLRRAHHFLALCMGTHGPSYRGAKFEEVFSRGLRGECLHAGPYLTPSGDLSAQRVMDALEWDGEFKQPQQKGMVVGAGSGRPDRDSCFDICTIENPTRHFACPFGEVVGGWDTVMAIVDYRPVRGVTMVDVGVVVPDGVLPGT